MDIIVYIGMDTGRSGASINETTMRPQIDMERGDELYSRIEQYAEDNGLRLERAYRELLVAGLKSETDYQNNA